MEECHPCGACGVTQEAQQRGQLRRCLSLIWDGLNLLDDRAHSIENDCVFRPVHLCIAGLDGLDEYVSRALNSSGRRGASADYATEGLGTEGNKVEHDGKADKSVSMFIEEVHVRNVGDGLEVLAYFLDRRDIRSCDIRWYIQA